jgi:hypothetical protein
MPNETAPVRGDEAGAIWGKRRGATRTFSGCPATPTRLCFGRVGRRRRRSPICRSQTAAERDSVRVFASFPDSALDSQALLSPLAQLSGFFLCFCAACQVVDGTFQVGAFWRGRCDRRGKSSGPPLLKLSLKVKRNSAHSQSSAFVVAPVLWPQRAWSLKGPSQT